MKLWRTWRFRLVLLVLVSPVSMLRTISQIPRPIVGLDTREAGEADLRPLEVRDPRLFDIGAVTENILNAGSDVAKNIEAFYFGWVDSNSSSAFFPNFLKGSTYLNSVYGAVNRTGLVVAGGALLGAGAIALMKELGLFPSVDDFVGYSKVAEGIFGDIFDRVANIRLTAFNRKDSNIGKMAILSDRLDTVHTLPGPPYDYDFVKMKNLTTNTQYFSEIDRFTSNGGRLPSNKNPPTSTESSEDDVFVPSKQIQPATFTEDPFAHWYEDNELQVVRPYRKYKNRRKHRRRRPYLKRIHRFEYLNGRLGEPYQNRYSSRRSKHRQSTKIEKKMNHGLLGFFGL